MLNSSGMICSTKCYALSRMLCSNNIDQWHVPRGKYEGTLHSVFFLRRPHIICGSRIWSRGVAPQKFLPRFCRRSEASQYWQGSCIFNSQICILPLFLVLFLQIILCTFVWVNYKISISIWKILNILANAIFLFSIWDNQGSYMFIYFCSQIHYSVSRESGIHLGPQKLSHF